MPNENINPEDELQAENEVLRLKLEMQGGIVSSAGVLPAGLENKWLNYIYNYEETYKNAVQATVYELIGRPEFRKLEELKEEEIATEIDKVMDILHLNGFTVQAAYEYPVSNIYKFITEELFEQTITDMRLPDARTCFFYEHFHPNHEHDLRNWTKEYAESIFSKKWDKKFSLGLAANTICFNGITLSQENLSDKVANFQDLHKDVTLLEFTVLEVDYDTEKWQAKVETTLKVKLQLENGEVNELKTPATFYYETGDWDLYKMEADNFAL